MDIPIATISLSALAHETRLSIFQIALRAGPVGIRAGDISAIVDVRPSTLSGHLNILKQADLVITRRERQQIFYSANVKGMNELIRFLTEDCCGGHPEICDGVKEIQNLPN